MEGINNGCNGAHTLMDRTADLAGLGPADVVRMSAEEIRRLLGEFAAMRSTCESRERELARLQAELAALQARMGDIAGRVPVACLALDAEHHILDINQEGADLLGASPAALRGRDFRDFVSPPSRQDYTDHFQETARRRGARICHLKLVRSDGDFFYAQMNSRPASSDAADGACIRTVVTDITGHRSAIEALSRLAAIVESSDDAIIGKDLDSRITSWNAGAERIYGYRAAEIIGKPISALLPAENVNGAITILEGLKQGRRIDHHVSVHVTKDGRPIDVSVTVSPIRDADGNIVGASTIARDITERRRAAEAVRASEEHLRVILNASPDAIMQVGADLKVVWANKAAADMVGDIVGRCCCDIYGDPEAAEQHCASKRALQQGQTVTTTFCLIDEKGSGREVCWENVGVPLRNADGAIAGALLIARDVTRRKQAERAMLEYQQKLRRQGAELVLAEERERRRLAMALHDNIIQDLAISMLRVEMLRESARSLDRKLLDDFARTLSKVIDDTRSMTFDISSPTLYRLGLAAAVDELLDDFLQSRHGIRCRFCDDGRDKPLDHDIQVLMFQSVRELLVNIVKHAEADDVDVCIGRQEGMMRLTVSDNGKGFDVDHMELTMHRTGGFGLFSIRERLDYVGGRMEIHSESGKGSRFTLYAPLKV